jgi:hypothetical protein
MESPSDDSLRVRTVGADRGHLIGAGISPVCGWSWFLRTGRQGRLFVAKRGKTCRRNGQVNRRHSTSQGARTRPRWGVFFMEFPPECYWLEWEVSVLFARVNGSWPYPAQAPKAKGTVPFSLTRKLGQSPK